MHNNLNFLIHIMNTLLENVEGELKGGYNKKILLQGFLLREIKLARDILQLLKNDSYYDAIILTSSLIESVITYKYFTIFPKKLLDYKDFSYIEDLSTYRYPEKMVKRFNIDENEAKEIYEQYGNGWNSVPEPIQKYILNFCKKNYKRFCKRGVTFNTDEDYLNRDNYVRYILPNYETIFNDVIKHTEPNSEWIGLKIDYSRACKYKHFNSEKISVQLVSDNNKCIFKEHQKDCDWCIRVVNTSIVEAMKMSYDEKIISQDVYYGFCGPMMGIIYPEEKSQ